MKIPVYSLKPAFSNENAAGYMTTFDAAGSHFATYCTCGRAKMRSHKTPDKKSLKTCQS